MIISMAPRHKIVAVEKKTFDIIEGDDVERVTLKIVERARILLLKFGLKRMRAGSLRVSFRAVSLPGTTNALLEYERHKRLGGELRVPVASLTEHTSVENQAIGIQGSGSGRARRDAAARAMQGWHSQRLLGNGEVGDPIIKDKNSSSMSRREKQLKSVGLHKRKKPSNMDHAVKAARTKPAKPQMDTVVVDIGASADWVKINVRRTKDCFEVYALVPGLLREEVRVQSDPAGRLVISGEPEHPDNPWGVTPFKKVISLPSRIDPHQTSAVVTLHGQLFVRVPFEQPDL
ncbi:hypothetical protein HHK36_010513 [Tetracentron sinense]|uniref:SHSP domain-containing protein n=1 Tax=Tetracentron sinense TaxID=13715 RepID=A0A834ZKX9_TETSI|nr:hypothetical protein HHK36_010513 [Tetracentron sinense]